MRIYLSGPMRGFPNENSAAFVRTAKTLRGAGFTVISPIELSRKARQDHKKPLNKLDALPFPTYLRYDLRAITTVDAIVVMPGWEQSVGVGHELDVAAMLEIPAAMVATALDYRSIPLERWPRLSRLKKEPPAPPTATLEAEALVHGPRNADYGHPAENDARIARTIRALFGWEVKPTDIWQLMVVIKLSRERNRAKHDNRVDIAGYAEVGDWIHRAGRANG